MQKIIIGVLLFLIVSGQLSSEVSAVYSFGQGIRGYDPLAYFTNGKATKGNAKFVYSWAG